MKISMALEKHANHPGVLSVLSPANPVRVVASNPAPSVVGTAIGGHIFNTAANGVEVVNETIRVGGYTAAVVSGCQCLADSVRWFRGDISSSELGRRTVKNATVNGTSVVGGAGGSTVGATIGTAILPGTGTVVGSVVGGFCGSVGMGKLINDKFEDWWTAESSSTKGNKNPEDDPEKMLNLSLQYFGFSPKNFTDVDVVTMDTITQRYREYARVYHPDKGGTKEEWLCLVNHYAVVSNAIRNRDRIETGQGAMRYTKQTGPTSVLGVNTALIGISFTVSFGNINLHL